MHRLSRRRPQTIGISLSVRPGGDSCSARRTASAGKSTLEVKVVLPAWSGPGRRRDLMEPGNPGADHEVPPARCAFSASAWCSSNSRCSTRSPSAENIALALDDHAAGPDARRASATCRSATVCRSIRSATCTACRWASASALRSCAACCSEPRLLIMDEPTSVLTPQAVEKLLRDAAPAGGRRLQHPLHQPQARTRSARCATARRSCAAGRVTGECDPTTGDSSTPRAA